MTMNNCSLLDMNENILLCTSDHVITVVKWIFNLIIKSCMYKKVVLKRK